MQGNLERMSKFDCMLEMELGVTGGEEDGVDNSDVDESKLYTQPEEVRGARGQRRGRLSRARVRYRAHLI